MYWFFSPLIVLVPQDSNLALFKFTRKSVDCVACQVVYVIVWLYSFLKNQLNGFNVKLIA